MTEVTTYPHVNHRFGGYSHRLLAPAPEHRHPGSSAFFSPDLFRDAPLLAPMDYHDHFGLPRSSSSDDRSMSVSSTASSASRHTPESRSHHHQQQHHQHHHQQQQQHHQQPSYASLAHIPPSALLPGPSPYLQVQAAQLGPQISLYPQDPSPRLPGFGQPSPYNFQYSCLPSQPSHISIQNYPPIYPSYEAPSTYRPLPAPPASYRQSPHLLQIQEPETSEPCRLMQMPPEVIKLIREHAGYLLSARLVSLSRWCRENFNASHFSEQDLIVGIAEAEKTMKRYFLTGKSVPRETQLQGITPSNSYACYHCFKMRSPENFELFIWHFQTAAAATTGSDEMERDDDTESHHSFSMTVATSSGPTTPRQRHPSISTSSTSSSSANPYYDPTLTRSSIKEAQKAAAAAKSGGSSSNNNNRSNSPATPTPGFASIETATTSTGPPLAGRVKSTFGIRRFCIDCGVRKGYYRSKDLIEVHGGKNLVKWVCGCRRVRIRSESPSCDECGLHSPYEPPGGRRRIS